MNVTYDQHHVSYVPSIPHFFQWPTPRLIQQKCDAKKMFSKLPLSYFFLLLFSALALPEIAPTIQVVLRLFPVSSLMTARQAGNSTPCLALFRRSRYTRLCHTAHNIIWIGGVSLTLFTQFLFGRRPCFPLCGCVWLCVYAGVGPLYCHPNKNCQNTADALMHGSHVGKVAL